MNGQMIAKIEKCLDNLKQKPIKVNQNGFIINQFFMDKLIYKIQSDILNLRDETQEIYLSINLNQAYQIEISEDKIIMFLDNDTEIEITI